jgi:hypothetical protein
LPSGRCPSPRAVPGRRALGIAFRTVHIASFGALLGGQLFAVDPERLGPWLLATVLSGGALVALELASTGAWLTTVKGLAVVAKLALLAGFALVPEHRVTILLLVVILASVSSHMPARYRHHQLVAAWREPEDSRSRLGPSRRQHRARA